ncbi:MAG: arsenate reductase [Halieaceae bacterium]
MTAVLFGISNCDTVRKARRWLDARHITYRFHDFRKDGTDPVTVRAWIARSGWELVVNRRSSSWKALAEPIRTSMDAPGALDAILQQPTLVKRPVLVTDEALEFGFSEARYGEIFAD